MLGGEGIVSKFSGRGRVWIQTRDPAVFQARTGGDDQGGDGGGSSGIDPGDFL
jgi:hypothetical protein